MTVHTKHIVHLTCDRCGLEAAHRYGHPLSDWATVTLAKLDKLRRVDLCPTCIGTLFNWLDLAPQSEEG